MSERRQHDRNKQRKGAIRYVKPTPEDRVSRLISEVLIKKMVNRYLP